MAEESKLMGFSDLFLKSWEIFKKVWVTYLWLYLISIFLVGGIFIITIGGSFYSLFLKTGEVSPNFDWTAIGAMAPALLAGIALAIIVGVALSLAMAKLVYGTASGETVKFSDSMNYAFKNYFQYLWVSFVLGLIVVAGYILLIVPGVIASVFFFAVPAVFILENNHTLNALSRARDLVSGYFWPVLGRLSALFAVGFLANTVINSIPDIGRYLSPLVGFVLAPITLAYMFYLYRDLRAIKKS